MLIFLTTCESEMPTKPKIVYCSWSKYKIEEWETVRRLEYEPGKHFDDVIEFEFRKVATREPLLCDLSAMVRAKVISAYQAVRVPCVVEHAGLILGGYEVQSYPGGLTQPMWDALGAEKFVATCSILSKAATARAVIGYCDGANVEVFVGDTFGELKSTPSGKRDFYWDPVFCPDGFGGKTYAEIADSSLADKLSISQSIKALRQFVAHRIGSSPMLFPGL
ncbi:non-canonical purine NTP pyrophosphatase [Azospirillum sp. SYSU D00513]|uniref:non-canonical purine NTP pyrophosphatase n=1 Tax=Azospirillum sp. SYSU D00513 TaxID=2812561 RepID=UPI001A97AE8E|nr:non-canonical purine NTP pyrophosphatase [Azospirillum sp. SYSU D00513]